MTEGKRQSKDGASTTIVVNKVFLAYSFFRFGDRDYCLIFRFYFARNLRTEKGSAFEGKQGLSIFVVLTFTLSTEKCAFVGVLVKTDC